MNSFRKFTAFAAALILSLSAAGCSSKDSVSISISEISSSSDSNSSSDSSTSTTAPPELPSKGSVSDIITPSDDDEQESLLGEYRLSSSGTKLYYDNTAVSDEIMLTLESYFKSYASNDFEAYKSCIFPGYAEHMEAFLQRDYSYGLDSSFQKQCDSLSAQAGDNFTITRIRAVPAGVDDAEMVEAHEHEATTQYFDLEHEIKSYLGRYDSFFDTDYYKEVSDLTSDFHYLTFSVIAADSEGNETKIVDGYRILFAGLNGRYYTFG